MTAHTGSEGDLFERGVVGQHADHNLAPPAGSGDAGGDRCAGSGKFAGLSARPVRNILEFPSGARNADLLPLAQAWGRKADIEFGLTHPKLLAQTVV